MLWRKKRPARSASVVFSEQKGKTFRKNRIVLSSDDTTATDTDTSAVTTEDTTPATSDTEAEGQVGTGEWTKLY